MSMPQANRYAPGFGGFTTTATAWFSGSGWFTPKSFITISVAQVLSTLRVTTSFTVSPAFAFTSAGVKPSSVTVSSMVRSAFFALAFAGAAALGADAWATFTPLSHSSQASEGRGRARAAATRAAGASFQAVIRFSGERGCPSADRARPVPAADLARGAGFG